MELWRPRIPPDRLDPVMGGRGEETKVVSGMDAAILLPFASLYILSQHVADSNSENSESRSASRTSPPICLDQ